MIYQLFIFSILWKALCNLW